MDCLFCKIVNGNIPCKKIYEDDFVLAFLDINPTANGHTLIIPKKHFKDLDDIDEENLSHIYRAAKKIKKLLEEKLNIEGLTLVQNNGVVQAVKHYHLHLIPMNKESEFLKPNDNIKDIDDIFNLIKK